MEVGVHCRLGSGGGASCANRASRSTRFVSKDEMTHATSSKPLTRERREPCGLQRAGCARTGGAATAARLRSTTVARRWSQSRVPMRNTAQAGARGQEQVRKVEKSGGRQPHCFNCANASCAGTPGPTARYQSRYKDFARARACTRLALETVARASRVGIVVMADRTEEGTRRRWILIRRPVHAACDSPRPNTQEY